tara:strand:+ start:1784 stop:3802 length:2019 start_codon:yes stop_codon:yes gene_type:complete
MSDMEESVQVLQSTESASKFTVIIGKQEVVLTFLSSKKGRIDFSIDLDGKPKGKLNLLSQHSITRFVSSAGISEGEKQLFKDTMLEVGVIIRDAKYVPAPEVVKIPEIDKYLGQDSTLGAVDVNTIEKFLADDLLLDKINKILHESRDTPFIGDDANLILTFLVIMSCKTDNPLNLEMVATSAAGKTYMVLTARNGVPKSMCMVLAGASKEALKYDYDEIDDDGNFIIHVDNKCIIVLEKDDSYAFVKKMKPLMSGDDDELIWKTPIKNELTGEIETRDFIIRGQPSFITLTTRNPTEQEQITRTLLMTPDTTVGKVSSVVKNSLLAKANPDLFQVHKDLTLLQASMLSLNKYRVRNIFAPQMADFFPSRSAQHQRDIGKVLSIIDSITLLHQNQRPIYTNPNGEQFLLSSIEDNIIGLVLADLVLRASLSGVPDDSWATFTQMIKMDESSRALTIDNILQWLHIHAFSLSKNALIEKHLPTLEDSGLIEVLRRGGGRGGKKKTFKIVKTRKGLMDNYSLTPLFVEGIRNNLMDIISEYKKIINDSEVPKSVRNLDKGEGNVLKDFGCENKKQSKIWRSIFLPTYFRPVNDKSMMSKVIGDSEHRDMLFSGNAWLDTELESDATIDLEKHRDIKERVREASKVHVNADDNDVWDALMENHFSEDNFSPTNHS